MDATTSLQFLSHLAEVVTKLSINSIINAENPEFHSYHKENHANPWIRNCLDLTKNFTLRAWCRTAFEQVNPSKVKYFSVGHSISFLWPKKESKNEPDQGRKAYLMLSDLLSSKASDAPKIKTKIRLRWPPPDSPEPSLPVSSSFIKVLAHTDLLSLFLPCCLRSTTHSFLCLYQPLNLNSSVNFHILCKLSYY